MVDGRVPFGSLALRRREEASGGVGDASPESDRSLIPNANHEISANRYVLPKGLDSAWKVVRGQVFGVPARRKRGWKSDFAVSTRLSADDPTR